MTILVCDDDKEIVDAIEIYLIQEGYQVVKHMMGNRLWICFAQRKLI